MSAAATEAINISALAEQLRVPLARVARRLRLEAQKIGLSTQDVFILSAIKKKPGVGVSELAEADQISRPTMSSHIKRLEAAGWITRTEDAADGRRSGFTVTPTGLRKLEAIRRSRNDWLAVQLGRLTPDELHRLAAAAEPLANLTGRDL